VRGWESEQVGESAGKIPYKYHEMGAKIDSPVRAIVAIGLRQRQDSKILNYLLKQQKQHGNGQK